MAISWLEIVNLEAGKMIADDVKKGLSFRKTAAGKLLAYLRYTHDGKKDTLAIGNLKDKKSKQDGYTLDEIREKADALLKLHKSGTTDIRGHIEHEQQRISREREQQQRAEEEKERHALLGNLGRLMTLYVEYLQWQGKVSAKQVARDLNTHLYKHAIAEIMADKVTAPDLRDWLSPLVQAGKTNTADKLRTYINAAYNLALTAESNPALPVGFVVFAAIDRNPAVKIPKLHRHSTKNERTVLTADELRAYYQQLKAHPHSAHNDVLLLSLLLAGQRTTQLASCVIHDINRQDWIITQWDGKGRRSDARRHDLPLQGESLQLITRRMQTAQVQQTDLLFTNDKVVVSKYTLSNHCSDISKKMLEAGLVSLPFGLHDVRRACETVLSKMGVSKDMKAQLLSHGMSGVQDKHYDRHDYMDEKRRALIRWQDMLNATPAAKIIPMRAKAA
jgi:integrase